MSPQGPQVSCEAHDCDGGLDCEQCKYDRACTQRRINYRKARTIMFAFWSRTGPLQGQDAAEYLADVDPHDNELLVCADALEELGFPNDAEWLRESHKIGTSPGVMHPAPPGATHMFASYTFVGHSVAELPEEMPFP